MAEKTITISAELATEIFKAALHNLTDEWGKWYKKDQEFFSKYGYHSVTATRRMKLYNERRDRLIASAKENNIEL